ncbi:3-hydroxyacyl-CoA dehydrogenase family protein [Actinophytocola gossypii]|uniref:3-hydroxyacyl-CoA dehydrogenase family protein n=1 Tax=Actinophytocola gossypii TaxID=2812003 RepID=A0ABT2J6P3_9PSEU|nr:3-hydroxyacyl-CoA dehydrogenase family protein [Actinophytocola gossypii]MCT2582939.1 3-hydroxyacyl-CoA dehydrogenase family protein [Actinophytocola gossypii]
MTVPGTAVVVGGGTMGAGIAHVLLAAGTSVTVAEADAARAEAARGAVEASLRKAEERGKLDRPRREVLGGLSTVDDLAALPGDAELVVEAVPEDLGLKQRVLATAARACPDAVLASNTSSLSITALADGLPGERVIGMHFFNPVPVQALVELVTHGGLPAGTVATVRGYAEALGKTVIEVRDSPGFATSRLGVAVGLEAIRMLEEGVASAEDIDTGMRLGYGWPMGPLRLTDLVGLDVRLSIASHLEGALGPRFAPPELLSNKVARGELGRKTGRGFFDWS